MRHGRLGEIVVTATRKAESVQKVPISIQALGAKSWNSTRSPRLPIMPACCLRSASPASARARAKSFPWHCRGWRRCPPAAPISMTCRFPRLRACPKSTSTISSGRGAVRPQGTLYGAGSLAGTLRIITNKAKIGKFEAGTTQVDAYGKGAAGAMVEGFVNIPVSEHVAVRMMGFYDHEGGYIDNTHGTYTYQLGDNDPNTTYTVDNATLVQKNYNPVDSYGGRINATIEAGTGLYPSVTYQYLDAKGFFNYDPRVGDLKCTITARPRISTSGSRPR
jgi:outer membrane receptor protein involved in Fe transport